MKSQRTAEKTGRQQAAERANNIFQSSAVPASLGAGEQVGRQSRSPGRRVGNNNQAKPPKQASLCTQTDTPSISECDKTAVPLFHSRQLDDGWCKPVRQSCVTVASGEFPHSKVVCSETLVSRSSVKLFVVRRIDNMWYR